jgi:hypothetical protein
MLAVLHTAERRAHLFPGNATAKFGHVVHFFSMLCFIYQVLGHAHDAHIFIDIDIQKIVRSWLCAQERWNPELVGKFGEAARY